MADEADNLVAIMDGIDRCANAAADSVVSHCPGLDRERIHKTVAYEIWLAICEATEFARRDAVA